MKLQWSDKITDLEIALPENYFIQEEVLPRRVIFHYGAWKKELRLRYDLSLAEDTLLLSPSLLQPLLLPDTINYMLQWDGRNLQLGPVIAFITVSEDHNLAKNLEKYEVYYTSCQPFKGLIYICAISGIDTKKKTIRGYYYDQDQWYQGVFPYPGAVYRKTGFNQRLYNEMIAELGDRMFNTYYFNKWELWEWLSQSPLCRPYLPHSTKLTDRESLERMLIEHGEVYLKQTDSHKAKGIMKVIKDDKGLHFIYRLKETVSLHDTGQINAFIDKINCRNNYFIQQAIPLKPYEDRNFDFRVIMQKDKLGEWNCTGNIARFGKKNSIATNFLLDGFAMRGAEALKLVFQLEDRDAFAKEQAMIKACVTICKTLDTTVGHYGDLGVDVIVDDHQNIWILEVNKLHDHKYPLYALQDEQMYRKVLATPFHYAAKLAGF